MSLRLIGRVRLFAGGVDVTPRGRKARALIAVLALSAGGAASRDRIAALLWSDRGEDQARASLRQCLTELRGGVLGTSGALCVERDQVRLRLDVVAVDLSAALEAARTRALGPLTELLRDFRSDLLGQLDGLSPALDEWLQIERVAQREAVIAAGIAAADFAGADADPASLAALLGELERLDPGNEVVARLGLRAGHAAGDTGSLHRRFQRLQEVLRREFGVTPSDETAALFATLKAGGPRAGSIPAPVPATQDAPPLLHVAEFVDSTQGEFAHVAATLRSEVLSGLSRFRDLRLAVERPTMEPGGYRLLATIRPSRSGLTISPQLLRDRGELVWADKLDLAVEDLQAGVDLIVGRMVGAILPALMTDVVALIRPRPAGGLYSRYLLAKHAAQRPPDHETALAAARELEAIIAADAGFASPRLALARIYDTDFVWTRAGSSGAAERARAFELSRQALALDHDNVNAWTHVGWSHLWHGNWTASEQALDAALTLNPYNVARLLEVAFGRIYLGNLDGAATLIDRCLTIEPRPGDNLHGDRGLLDLMRGRYDEAAAGFDMVAAPDLLMAIHATAAAAMAGRPVALLRARAEDAIRKLFPGERMPALDDLLVWLSGCHPFRHDHHRQAFLSAVAKAFG